MRIWKFRKNRRTSFSTQRVGMNLVKAGLKSALRFRRTHFSVIPFRRAQFIVVGIVVVIVLLMFPSSAFAAAPYDGGTGDGWASGDQTHILIGYGMITPTGTQTFTVGDAATAISSLNFLFGDTILPTTITGLRLIIPANLPLIWHPSTATATISGAAASKFSSAVTFENSNKTVVIALNSNTVDGDTVTISGLKFTNFTAPTWLNPYYLSADTNNDGVAEMTDDTTKVIYRAGRADVYGGGTGDGWNMLTANDFWVGAYTRLNGGVRLKGGVRFK